MSDAYADNPAPAAWIRDHARVIAGIVAAEATPTLLRFDTHDDLVQGATQEAIKSAIAGDFVWLGDDAGVAWLCTVTRRHLHARREYWFAGKRAGGGAELLRITLSGLHEANRAGPATIALRREQLVLARKAIELLLPRDREIVLWIVDGATGPEIAVRLGVTELAAERARTRAMERLRKAYAVLSHAAGHGASHA